MFSRPVQRKPTRKVNIRPESRAGANRCQGSNSIQTDPTLVDNGSLDYPRARRAPRLGARRAGGARGRHGHRGHELDGFGHRPHAGQQRLEPDEPRHLREPLHGQRGRRDRGPGGGECHLGERIRKGQRRLSRRASRPGLPPARVGTRARRSGRRRSSRTTTSPTARSSRRRTSPTASTPSTASTRTRRRPSGAGR